MRTKRTWFSGPFAALLLSVALLTGCVPRPSADIATTAAPYPQEEKLPYEQYQENELKEQSRFSQLEEQLFLEQIRGCQLDLQYLLRHPENFGISSAENLFAPISMDAMEENRQTRQQLKEELDSFNPALLSEEQEVTFHILQSLLKTEALSEGLELYYQPLSATIGIQAELPILLCEYSFYEKQDIEEYLALLDAIDDYYKEILAFEQQKANAGLMMSDACIDHVIESCESYLLVPGNNFLIDSFNQRLDLVADLTEEEKTTYRQRNEQLLEESFVPAYQTLIDGMKKLKGTGTNEGGMCGFPDGKKYYKYLIYASTGTSYGSVEELIAAVEQTIQKKLKETSAILKEHPEFGSLLETSQFRQTEPAAMLEELKTMTANDFPPLPECSYTLKDVPKALELSLSPAFYLTSPIDDITNNVIYINHNPQYASESLYPTIAHEGYPGHLYQNVYFHSSDVSDLRKILSFSGYSEGWAAYVEALSYTLDNGLDPEFGRLLASNSMAILGLHAYLDLAVNYLGWDRDQVAEYLSQFYEDPGAVSDAMFQAMIENPANYLSYFAGAMEIQNMRENAEKNLGSRFSSSEFHKFILDMGNAPFDVIQPYFTSWLMEQKM
uniref:DUF885 domain-containing protein n=1 Tax=Candidatus Ventrimonas sp. TaxID=3048889 RepID=UPI003FF0CD08